MNLDGTSSLSSPLIGNESGADRNTDVRRRCQVAQKLEEAGDFEGASAVIGDLWQGIGERPRVEDLDEATQGEVLLRAGSISAGIGEDHQLESTQDAAMNLVRESVNIFERLGLPDKLVCARIELASCYWRQGAMDDARTILRELLSKVPEPGIEEKLRILANLVMVERTDGRFKEALQIQTEAAALFELSDNHLLRGNFHNGFGVVLKNLAKSEGRPDYLERALIEFTAASYHWDRSGHDSHVASVENCIGLLLLESARFVEAHQHLNRARAIVSKLRDKGATAVVDESRAKVFLAEERYTQAEIAARGAVKFFEEAEERVQLAEALLTQATALARLDRNERAAGQFQRATEVAQQAEEPMLAGLAALTMLEELSAVLPVTTMREAYENAESLLNQTENGEFDLRLAQCARSILRVELQRISLAKQSPASLSEAIQKSSSPETESTSVPWAGCALELEVLNFEGELIKRALEAANGSVTRAARMLGITHQGLAFILNGRHKNLLNVRTPVKRRRRSILRTQ